ARDVWQIVLPDRKAEFGLVDLHPRGAERVEQRQRLANRVAPAAVTQFDREWIVGEGAQQLRQVIARLRRALEAWRELREQRAQFAARGERFDAAAEVVDVRRRHLGGEMEKR